MSFEGDSIEEVTSIERTREELIQRFEEEYTRLHVAYRNIEDPSEQDADEFCATKAELRLQLCRDLLATVPTRDNSRLVFYQNFYDKLLQEAYNGSRTAKASVDQFQRRLRRANESQGLAPEEFDEIDHKHFMRYVTFIQNLLMVRAMMEGLDFDAETIRLVIAAEIQSNYKQP